MLRHVVGVYTEQRIRKPDVSADNNDVVGHASGPQTVWTSPRQLQSYDYHNNNPIFGVEECRVCSLSKSILPTVIPIYIKRTTLQLLSQNGAVDLYHIVKLELAQSALTDERSIQSPRATS